MTYISDFSFFSIPQTAPSGKPRVTAAHNTSSTSLYLRFIYYVSRLWDIFWPTHSLCKLDLCTDIKQNCHCLIQPTKSTAYLRNKWMVLKLASSWTEHHSWWISWLQDLLPAKRCGGSKICWDTNWKLQSYGKNYI